MFWNRRSESAIQRRISRTCRGMAPGARKRGLQRPALDFLGEFQFSRARTRHHALRRFTSPASLDQFGQAAVPDAANDVMIDAMAMAAGARQARRDVHIQFALP